MPPLTLLRSARDTCIRMRFNYGCNSAGGVAIEFAICSLLFIPMFMAGREFLLVNETKLQTLRTGNSVLRALTHVPEYDVRMRETLTHFCTLNKHPSDFFDIEVVAGVRSALNLSIDWSHTPCGITSKDFQPITHKELTPKLKALKLRPNEGFIAVKVVHVARGLERSKFFFNPESHTFDFLDVSVPKIANRVRYTKDQLYDIDSYEF